MVRERKREKDIQTRVYLHHLEAALTLEEERQKREIETDRQRRVYRETENKRREREIFALETLRLWSRGSSWVTCRAVSECQEIEREREGETNQEKERMSSLGDLWWRARWSCGIWGFQKWLAVPFQNGKRERQRERDEDTDRERQTKEM